MKLSGLFGLLKRRVMRVMRVIRVMRISRPVLIACKISKFAIFFHLGLELVGSESRHLAHWSGETCVHHFLIIIYIYI